MLQIEEDEKEKDTQNHLIEEEDLLKHIRKKMTAQSRMTHALLITSTHPILILILTHSTDESTSSPINFKNWTSLGFKELPSTEKSIT